MRHGKAEAFAEEDQRRRLTDRGRRDAAAVGRWLAEHDLVPTHAYVSSAARARATWEAVAEEAGATDTVVSFEGALYSAGPQTVLDTLRATPEEARVVMYVGHNPTAASLAHQLDDGDAEPTAFRAMSQGFPTSAIAVLEVPCAWADLDSGGARLVDFHGGHAR